MRCLDVIHGTRGFGRLTAWGSATLRLAIALAMAVGLAVPAHAGFAPTIPTYQLSWPTTSGPYGVAVDAQGSVYVAGYYSDRVQKFDGFGNLVAQWGSTGSGAGQFSVPIGVAVDGAGNVLVTDSGNNRVQRFTAAGAYLGQWGSLGAGPGQFNAPHGIAVDPNAGNVYVGDYNNSRIEVFSSSGVYLGQWGSAGSAPGQFSAPECIFLGPGGNVYVADAGNNRVQYFDLAGNYRGAWGTTGTGAGQFQIPVGIGGDGVGNLYVSELAGSRVQKFDRTGAYLGTWGATGSGAGQFSWALGVAVDPAGNVYVNDFNNNRVELFNGAGVTPGYGLPQFEVASLGGIFQQTGGMAVDPATGNLYLADVAGNKVYRLSGTAAVQTSFGTAGAGNGQFNQPTAVAVDGSGNVYVTDRGNNRVEKFNSSGTYVSQWGGPGAGAGQFNNPIGIAIDAANNVYVADHDNNRVQRFTTGGAFVGSWATTASPWHLGVDAFGNVYAKTLNTVEVYSPAGVPLRQWNAGGPAIAVDPRGFVFAGPGNTFEKYTSTGTFLGNPGALPSTTGALCSDPSGDLYVADASNIVRKYVDPPCITSVADVASDQGREVRIHFLRSSAEAANSGVAVGFYSVYRKIEALPSSSPGAALSRGPVTTAGANPASIQVAGWDYVGLIVATGAAAYDYTAATLANATSTTGYFSQFFVQANVTGTPLVHFDSGSASGYSQDNLAPTPVSPFVGVYTAATSQMHLHWGVSAAADFASFRLYKGNSADFVPGNANLLATTTDTGFVDPGNPVFYYKLTAVDLDGNESAPSLVSPVGTVDVPPAPVVFALEGARPSPTPASRVLVYFSLPVAAPAELEMFDVRGRRVAAREVGTLGPGPHAVDLADGRGQRIGPGLYFLRLRQGSNARTSRVTIFE